MDKTQNSMVNFVANEPKTARLSVLVAEDEQDIAHQYKMVLEARSHDVIITADGEECLKVYRELLKGTESKRSNGSPFDVVVLDYRMPKKNGMEVAKEILEMNSNQRIIFASAYVRETLIESVQRLRQIVEFMQKPFRLVSLVGTIEDKKISEELERINTHVRQIKDFNPNPGQLAELLDGLNKIQKGRDYLLDGLNKIDKVVQAVL